MPFQTVPDTYYELVDKRLPGHGEDLKRLAADRILIDGAPTKGGGLLLQIFTQTVIGPIFFEIIQRRATRASARAISAPCSNRSSSTRSAAAC